MRNIMLDLETLGTNAGCPIVSIGACYWEPTTGDIGEEFYITIQITDSLNQGFVPSGSTIEWWLQQSTEARDALFKSPKTVGAALIAFSNFVRSPKDNIWGNGCGFDNVILRRAYEIMNMDTPWYFRCDRDMRTLKSLAQIKGLKVPAFFREGTHHNALDDAKHQVEVCSWIVQRM